MAAAGRFKFKQAPIDNWSVREKLALASSVLRSGDQNWVSVSRAIKPFGEAERSSEWFGQKNCALQYSDLLEKVETPKRKRERGETSTGTIETPSIQIVRKLTIERIEELKQVVQEEQEKYRKIKEEIDLIRTGQWDDKVKELWEEIKEQQRASETPEKVASSPQVTPKKKTLPKLKIPTPGITAGEISTGDQSTDRSEEDSNQSQSSVSTNPQSVHDVKAKVTPPTSPHSTDNSQKQPFPAAEEVKPGLVQIKKEPPDEHEQLQETEQSVPNYSMAPQSIKQELIPSATGRTYGGQSSPGDDIKPDLAHTPTHGGKLSPAKAEKLLEHQEAAEDSKDEDEDKLIDVEGNEEELLEEAPPPVPTPTPAPAKGGGKASIPIVLVEDENPPSPASSIISNDPPEPSSRGRPRRKHWRNRRSTRLTKGKAEDDGKGPLDIARLTDTSDDETGSDVASTISSAKHLAVSESVPNSPASMSQCSDTEDEKHFRVWKKSIMLVWRAAANHKYANVFLHPVTNEIAPGYLGIVHRSMDLSLIKKNIEAGVIRTTAEFQRDMMLMFTNAIMYNNSDHNVYKMAVEMYNDVMIHIEQFVNTQMMVQSETKVLRTSRRSDVVLPDKPAKDTASDKEDDGKMKRRPSAEQEHATGGKIKKRKTRADD